MGGFKSDLRPPRLRCVSHFQFYDCVVLSESIFRIVTSDEPHLRRKRTPRRIAIGGGFRSDFRPPQLRGYQFSNFTTLPHFRKTNSANNYFRRVAFCRKRPSWMGADGGRISARLSPAAITRRFHFPILRMYRTFKTNFQNRHFRRVAFWSKPAILMDRQRWADFSPIVARRNYDGFAFSDFTILPYIRKLISRIVASY